MSIVPKTSKFLLAGLAVAVAGCTPAAPPPRVAVPVSPQSGGAVKTYEPLRPLRAPSPDDSMPPPAFDDVPLVTQATPELPAYLDAYQHVGKPRIAVYVNRTIEGQIIPVEERKLVSGVEVDRRTDAAVDIESSRITDAYGHRRAGSIDRTGSFKTSGPASVHETAEVYLAAGQYDEAQAKSIDYEAIELALADTLGANGKVTLVSPMMARQRLTDQEVKDLQSGRPAVLREIAEKLDVDVLIQAQARPTRQTADGLEIRVLVEAINTRGGESLARSFVDVPPPLEKTTINRYTRFLARKTMYGLTGAWEALSSDPAGARTSGPIGSSPSTPPSMPPSTSLPEPTTRP